MNSIQATLKDFCVMLNLTPIEWDAHHKKYRVIYKDDYSMDFMVSVPFASASSTTFGLSASKAALEAIKDSGLNYVDQVTNLGMYLVRI